MTLQSREWDKDPDDVDYRTFDWKAMGWLADGETITGTPTWTLAGGSGLTQPIPATNTTTTTTIWLGAGTDNTNGARYRVKNTIVTSLGRTKSLSWMVRVTPN